ncbi:Segregation and condensation protein A [hydrothermal vent metagenome]|uniref:Segregation and condensation protein A n=1 Tax=hydrothermal vent metagenome TaxID=652676 RepID=A0A3B0VMQ9_9ZZZZ
MILSETRNNLATGKNKKLATNVAQQAEMPFAVVEGKPFTTMPTDLYIPPDALEVILEAFEGPLDLLLYLIRRQNLDILDIPIHAITKQYVEYIELMHEINFELAAEYLVMAAMLAEIKSRMLLPKTHHDEDNEEDPRAELIRRLQEYERFKQAAEDIDGLPRIGRDVWQAKAYLDKQTEQEDIIDISIQDLVMAFKEVMLRADLKISHAIEREVLSVRDRMTLVLDSLLSHKTVNFKSLFKAKEGRQGALVSFLAVLELLKSHSIELVQNSPFGEIYLQSSGVEP